MRMAGTAARVRVIVSAKMPAPPSFDVVAIDRRDHHVLQAEGPDRVGDPGRLVEIERRRLAVRHRAVAAGARADVAEDHERGGAVMPALADVRAAGFLADRVQAEAAHQRLQLEVPGRTGRAHLQPGRLRGAGFRDRGFRGEGDDRGHRRTHQSYQGLSARRRLRRWQLQQNRAVAAIRRRRAAGAAAGAAGRRRRPGPWPGGAGRGRAISTGPTGRSPWRRRPGCGW